ncbi:myosin regulatory light chain interacting protein [Nesidiocoris tenuis]|uniref:Myosin regulatory light chain interacting protein n=1 Tax=Nesidiocoris tenuis TaxID=355587 RepID=A0ABN7ATG0_9HEMI|nr:myosin regulatory light chain interacting protein [Nesidiocoris tenuis]
MRNRASLKLKNIYSWRLERPPRGTCHHQVDIAADHIPPPPPPKRLPEPPCACVNLRGDQGKCPPNHDTSSQPHTIHPIAGCRRRMNMGTWLGNPNQIYSVQRLRHLGQSQQCIVSPPPPAMSYWYAEYHFPATWARPPSGEPRGRPHILSSESSESGLNIFELSSSSPIDTQIEPLDTSVSSRSPESCTSLFDVLALISSPSSDAQTEQHDTSASRAVFEDDFCITCISEKRDTSFVPCGHVLCCNACATRLDACPFCRADIDVCHKLIWPGRL